MSSTRNILVFQHEFREHPSRLNQYALEHNIELTVMRLWEPYEMPDPRSFDALVILGGSMSVRNDFPSKADELDAIKKSVGTVPVLGICLGGQLIANALGASVKELHIEDKPYGEVGFKEVSLTDDGKRSPLFKGFPDAFTVTQIHTDTFDVPLNAKHLVAGKECPNQAFSFDERTFGLQFHLEYTPYALAHLFDLNKRWIGDWDQGGEKRLMDETYRTEAVMQEQFDRLMDNFLQAG